MGSVLGEELHGFEPVVDIDAVAHHQEIGEISGKREAGHRCPVAVVVLGSPTRLDGVQISRGQGRFDQRVCPVDASVQKADIGLLRRSPRNRGRFQTTCLWHGRHREGESRPRQALSLVRNAGRTRFR